VSLPPRPAPAADLTFDLICFDVESTGVDTQNDRIVTAFIGRMNPQGFFNQQFHALVNPGVEIPEGAAAVHGITTEHARQNGRPPLEVLEYLRWVISFECLSNGLPLVAFNAPFDLTMLQAEFRRHSLPSFDDHELSRLTVIDPMVLDKHLTPIRRGKSRLTDIAPLYNVPVETNAHDAGADCLMTGRVALQMAKHPRYASYFESLQSLRTLHHQQIGWKRDQAAKLQAYFRGKGGKPDAVVNGGWPLQSGAAA
jgi:DNA polymerase-3 subunit epsilon